METIRVGRETSAPQIVSGERVRLELGEAPQRYYYHGWQSWSLAAWVDAGRRMPVQQPRLLHALQIDPAWAFHPRPHGSWVGAAKMADGQVVLLGSLALEAHVELDGTVLIGWYEGGSGAWFLARGDETAVFAAYAAELDKRLGHGSHAAPRGVWCSWYSLYTDIDEQLLGRVFDGLGDLPLDVLQVDDGWQQAIGDWEPNAKFPSGMQALASRIKATGRRAGLWLAPLIAVKSSRLFHAHPAWFIQDEHGKPSSAGFNWQEQLYALDTTQPAVQEWLTKLMQQVRQWGFDYLKLDFLYAGGLPGVRHEPTARETALRQGLQALRTGMGAEAFFLACGSPILPSLGLCDALRLGPDVSADWENERDARLLHNPAIPGTRSAIRTTLNRLWLRPLVIPDPDVAYFRSVECMLTDEQKHMLQALALICGFRATSDLPNWLSPAEREQLRAFLLRASKVEQLGAGRFRLDGSELDYRDAIEVPEYRGLRNAVEGAAFGWLANHTWAMKLDAWLSRDATERRRRRVREQ